jgi:hypothetical protein
VTRKRKQKIDEERDGRGTDLFVWLRELFTKDGHAEGTPPIFQLARFLVDERQWADVVHMIYRDVRDSKRVYHVLKGWLPRKIEQPRLAYCAPKKPLKEEAIIAAIMRHRNVRREVAEEMFEIVKLTGQHEMLCHEYGLEVP